MLNFKFTDGGVTGDLGIAIRKLDYRAESGSAIILLLVMVDFLVLVLLVMRKQSVQVTFFLQRGPHFVLSYFK